MKRTRDDERRQLFATISNFYGSLHPLTVKVKCSECEWEDDLFIIARSTGDSHWPHGKGIVIDAKGPDKK